jgi:hypothetical protein
MGIDYSQLAYPKGERRQTRKGRQQRQEVAVKRSVRAACVERDGFCRLGDWEQNPDDWHSDALEGNGCDGRSEWAHLAGHRRSQTRGQAPERRHTTARSLMLCRRHHTQEERGELKITYQTERGCDGPLRFR